MNNERSIIQSIDCDGSAPNGICPHCELKVPELPQAPHASCHSSAGAHGAHCEGDAEGADLFPQADKTLQHIGA